MAQQPTSNFRVTDEILPPHSISTMETTVFNRWKHSRLLPSTAMFLSHIAAPTSLLLPKLDFWPITRRHRRHGCFRLTNGNAAFYVREDIPSFLRPPGDTTIQVTKSICLIQLFCYKNKVRLLDNPVLRQNFTLLLCKTHSKHAYIVAQAVERKNPATYLGLHSVGQYVGLTAIPHCWCYLLRILGSSSRRWKLGTNLSPADILTTEISLDNWGALCIVELFCS